MIECYMILIMIILYWLGALVNALKFKGSRKTVWQFQIRDRTEAAICGLWLFVYAGLVGMACYHDDPSELWELRSAAKLILALILYLCAIVITQWCYRVLGSQWQVSKDIPKNYKLITAGPFKYLRHPIYFAQILVVTGCAVIFSDVISLMLLIFFILLVRFKSKSEERVMTEQFGDTYVQYCKRTFC